MTLRIGQDSQFVGEDWWRWWIWIEGPEGELDEVESVVYTLHPTFPDPVRKVADRASKFRLETAGWGTFTIYAKVHRRDGEVVKLEHELELRYPDGREAQA